MKVIGVPLLMYVTAGAGAGTMVPAGAINALPLLYPSIAKGDTGDVVTAPVGVTLDHPPIVAGLPTTVVGVLIDGWDQYVYIPAGDGAICGNPPTKDGVL